MLKYIIEKFFWNWKTPSEIKNLRSLSVKFYIMPLRFMSFILVYYWFLNKDKENFIVIETQFDEKVSMASLYSIIKLAILFVLWYTYTVFAYAVKF